MKSPKTAKILDLTPNIEGDHLESINAIAQTLKLIDTLYSLQICGRLSENLEKLIFSQFVESFKAASTKIGSSQKELKEELKEELETAINALEKGIYDILPITVQLGEGRRLKIFIGKVISPDLGYKPMWAGALGLVNNGHKNLLDEFDSQALQIYDRSFNLAAGNKKPDKPIFPGVECVDVIRYYGSLNQRHKPIGLFYATSEDENLSVLSNMAIFMNYYALRFLHISKAITREYFEKRDMTEQIDFEMAAKTLLIWLRGHDIGHFWGEDNIKKAMDAMDPVYLILHELKSDFVSLHLIANLGDDLLTPDQKRLAYIVFCAEMLRYIRRGNLNLHPDSASAYVAYRRLLSTGAIFFKPKSGSKSGRLSVNFVKFEETVEKFTRELIEIFDTGNAEVANKVIGKTGDLAKPLDELDLEGKDIFLDTDIPYYLEIE